ncbi:MAG TPA: hypothetical protein VNI01_14350, partial [Elusimicrobiota bacterium]|nr:hypothetical protein [Elusimicrobiota bacterium]
AKAFAGRSLIIVAPDDGAFPMALEAAQVLGRWLQKRWGVSLDVRAAHFDKVRSSAHTVEIAPELKAGGGKALALPEGHSLADAAAFVVDDAKKRMAPARFFASDSLALPDGMAGSTVGLGPLVGWVAQTENP